MKKLLFILLLFSPAIAAAQSLGEKMVVNNELAVKARDKYLECIKKSLYKYKDSKETADVIALGAMGNCSMYRQEMRQYLVAAGLDDSDSERLCGQIDGDFNKMAIAAILNVRVAKQ